MATFSFTGLLPQFKALISSAQLRNRFNDLKTYLDTTFNPAGLTLPNANGSSGQVLQSDGDGTTSWLSFSGLTDSDKGDITVSSSGSVWTINNGAVETAMIADSNVTTAKLATNAVTTVKITDANVTAAKLATDSVETAKIADSNVTTTKIADSNVTYAKIQNVTDNRLLGNATGGAAAPSEITVGDGLTFGSSALSVTNPVGIASLSSDISTTSTSYTDATGLAFTPASDTNYHIRLSIPYNQSANTTDFQLVMPINHTYVRGYWQKGNNSSEIDGWITDSTLTLEAATSNSGGNFMYADLILAVGSSASGDFKLQYKTTSGASSTTIKEGATLKYIVV